jgi:hypothetical protein
MQEDITTAYLLNREENGHDERRFTTRPLDDKVRQ